MTPDERAIRELHSTWIDAVNAGDLARLLTLMADDCLFLNPGREPCGRDDFSAAFTAAHKEAWIHCNSALAEVVVIGEVAYTRSRDSVSVIPRERLMHPGQRDESAAQFAGDRLTIYRKQPDGRWFLARDAHTVVAVEKARA